MKSISWRHLTELAAAVSIVISLIFVGYELRENAAIARAESFNQYAISNSEITFNAAADPDLAQLIRRATSGGAVRTSFDEEERFRIFLIFQSYLDLHDGLFKSVEEGILARDDLSAVTNTRMYNGPYFSYLWYEAGLRELYTAGFVEYFELLEWNNELL